MPLLNEADKIYVGSALAAKVYLGSTQVWPSVSSPTYSAMQYHALFTALQVVSTRNT
jgi:hypothetical protein